VGVRYLVTLSKGNERSSRI
jgi:hypothetical protein